SNAPTAIIKPARTGMWGKNMLEIASFTKPQTLVSSPMAIPEANREYEAVISAQGNNITTTLSVIDTVTGAVLASGDARSTDRGFAATIPFTPATTNPVKLKVNMVPIVTTPVTVDVDGADITRSRNFGVVASSSSYYFPKQLTAASIINTVKNVKGVTIKNGTLQ